MCIHQKNKKETFFGWCRLGRVAYVERLLNETRLTPVIYSGLFHSLSFFLWIKNELKNYFMHRWMVSIDYFSITWRPLNTFVMILIDWWGRNMGSQQSFAYNRAQLYPCCSIEWLRGLFTWTSRVRTVEYGDAWESSTRRVPGKLSIKPVAENNVIELWSACLVQSPIIIVVHHPKAQNNQVEKWHQQPKLSYDRESTRNSLQLSLCSEYGIILWKITCHCDARATIPRTLHTTH